MWCPDVRTLAPEWPFVGPTAGVWKRILLAIRFRPFLEVGGSGNLHVRGLMILRIASIVRSKRIPGVANLDDGRIGKITIYHRLWLCISRQYRTVNGGRKCAEEGEECNTGSTLHLDYGSGAGVAPWFPSCGIDRWLGFATAEKDYGSE